MTALGDVVAALWEQWLQEFSTNKTKADEVNQERKDAETKLEDAKQELNVAETKLQNAQQKYEAKASAQAGPAQAGASACVVVPVVVVVRFRGGPPFLLFGVMLSSQQGSPRR